MYLGCCKILLVSSCEVLLAENGSIFIVLCLSLGKDAAGCVEIYTSVYIVGGKEDKLQTLVPTSVALCLVSVCRAYSASCLKFFEVLVA